MQKRFTGITMKPLMKINKHWLSFLIAMSLISCNHLSNMNDDKHQISVWDSNKGTDYENRYSSSQEEEKYEQIYCTPEDEKKGIKTDIDYLNVACGLPKIQPVNNKTLEIKQFFLGVEYHSDGGRSPIGHHLLILKSGDETLQEVKVETEDDIFWKEVLFVKIREGVYWKDLNNDGYLEFAILKTDTGYSTHRTVDLYTLKNNSFHFYGHGIYVWTTGQHVLFNCPEECNHHNPEACDKCT